MTVDTLVGFYRQIGKSRGLGELWQAIVGMERARRRGYKEIDFKKLRPLVGVLDEAVRKLQGRDAIKIDKVEVILSQILETYSIIPHSPSLSLIDSLLPHTFSLPLPEFLSSLSSLSKLNFTPTQEYLLKVGEIFMQHPSTAEQKSLFLDAFWRLEHKLSSQKYMPYQDGLEKFYRFALQDILLQWRVEKTNLTFRVITL